MERERQGRRHRGEVGVERDGPGRADHRQPWRPGIREPIDVSGPERRLFGSTCLIEMLWAIYDQVLDAVLERVSDLSAIDRAAVLRATAHTTDRS